jgi:hypothetical protein
LSVNMIREVLAAGPELAAPPICADKCGCIAYRVDEHVDAGGSDSCA